MTVTTQPQDGLYLNNLSPGSVIDVETKNHHYRIEYLTDDEITISGHSRLCPTPIRVQLQGSARGSGTFKPGFVGCGMHLVFRRFDERLPVTTSEIVSIQMECPLREDSIHGPLLHDTFGTFRLMLMWMLRRLSKSV
jgi:hypothetical protein